MTSPDLPRLCILTANKFILCFNTRDSFCIKNNSGRRFLRVLPRFGSVSFVARSSRKSTLSSCEVPSYRNSETFWKVKILRAFVCKIRNQQTARSSFGNSLALHQTDKISEHCEIYTKLSSICLK